MGGLVQQINLYRGDKRGASVSNSTRALLAAGVGAIVVVLLLAGGGEFYLHDLQQRRAAVAAKLENQRARVEQFRTTLVAPTVDPFLEAEVDKLRAKQRYLNANLVTIARAQDAGASDVSGFFAGLARNTLDGLWFSSVGLSAGGEQVLLKGKAVEPALVPRLLQMLAAEQAFAGRAFRKVSFVRSVQDDTSSPVEFELRSASPDEVDDAG